MVNVLYGEVTGSCPQCPLHGGTLVQPGAIQLFELITNTYLKKENLKKLHL